MTQYNVTLHKLFNGIIPELSQRQEVEIAASDRESAGKQAVASFGGEGWVVTNVELLGGPESENVKGADHIGIIGEKDREIAMLEHRLADQIRINEKTAANCNKARKRRKAAEKQNEYLQEQEENLRDWIKDDQAKLKAKQEELNQLKEMYTDIHGKHSNLIEKAAALDIENQKLREARKYEELGAVESEKRAREDAAKIVELHREIRQHERNREELLIERTKLRELVDVQREALEKFENTAQVDSHAIGRLQQQRTDDENRIKNLAEERDSILSKNRDLVKENADAKEMIRSLQSQQKDDLEAIGKLREERNSARDMYRAAQQQIDDLVHERPRKRPSQPMKPVEALVREQDTDARLWANSFANQFDLPEELDAEITGWFANAIETAKDSVRNKPKGARQYPEKLLPDFDMPKVMRDLLPEVPKPEGWEDPFQYAKRLQAVLQEFINGMMKKLQPVLDTVGPIVAEVEKEYPGWMASNYQTKQEWWGTQTTKDEGWSGAYDEAVKAHPELSVTVRQHPDSDFKPLKNAGKDPDVYEFVTAPKHYNDHPSGVECQVIIRECKDPLIAIAFKHLWRTQWGNKPGQTVDQDLGKAVEYIQLEQARRAGKDRL